MFKTLSPKLKSSYTYAGTNYANPHAVTSIGPIAFTYDNNGNLTGDGTWTHTYNYDNRLTQSSKTGTTVTYAYDPNEQRIKQNDGTTITIYPTKYYNKEGSTDIKHIYLPAQAGMGDTLIASVKGTGTSAVVSYIHTDHLGSTDKVTNTNAEISELSDYYPYGSPRISTTYSGSSEQRKYTGHEFDSQTELTYANARYYNGNTARFLSQDPIYLLVGSKKFEDKWKKNWRDVKEGKNSALNEYLSNPQNLNSYSYALNNPLKYTDPTGESAFWEEVFNFAAGRGFKTDAQVTGSDKNQFGLPNSYLTAPKNESNNQKQSEDYITRPGHEPDSYLSRGNEIGPSQEARYKVAGKIDNFSTALDAYSEVDNIPAASATIVSAVAAIPYVGQTTVAIATVAIGASFIVSNFISSGLNAVAEDIRN